MPLMPDPLLPFSSGTGTTSAPIRRRWRLIPAMIALLLGCSTGEAQTTVPAGDPVQATPPGQTSPAQRRARGPLLREGSFVASVQGRVHRDPATGWWSFATEPANDKDTGFDLILLPNSKLEDIKQVVDAMDENDEDLVFEISGRLFVFHGRNFLLATHAPQLIAYRPTAEDADTSADAAGDATEDADDESVGGDEVDDIMAELARDVGPLQRGVRGPAETESGGRLIREGTILLGRRGTLHRDEVGAWVFVFASDSAALEDPPAVVLPCLQLEQLEAFARTAGFAAPILLSGQVTRYEGRNYILPSIFRIPRERTLIEPGA